MKTLLAILTIAVGLAADAPKSEPKAATLAELQQTVKEQAALIDWYKAQTSALQAQLQASTAYFQSVLNLQQLERQKPPEPVKAVEKGTK